MKRFIIIAAVIVGLVMNFVVPILRAFAEDVDEMAGTPAGYVQRIDVKDVLENADDAMMQARFSTLDSSADKASEIAKSTKDLI